MSSRCLCTKTDKQIVLACFKAKLALRVIADRLDIPFGVISEWHARFLKGDQRWALFDDQDLIRRQEAFELFTKGHGYKYVASNLGISQSCSKYWQMLFKAGQQDFFNGQRRINGKYSKTLENEILSRFAASTDSKKRFCAKEGISVSTLNKWLRNYEQKNLL